MPATPAGGVVADLATKRHRRADAMDERLIELFRKATGDDAADGLSLVAVGGYGRAELSPRSDVDVVLLHAPGVAPDVVADVADAIWYPLWDDSVPLDHSVRSTTAMRRTAAEDVRAATGMLDARHVAGDRAMTTELRSAALTEWRRRARTRVPELREVWSRRVRQSGELAHAAVPDLKESGGGLRDAGVLRALVATWLVDVPHQQAEEHRLALLAVRDHLHEVTGRASDRLLPEVVPDVAAGLGVEPDELLVQVRDHGRRLAHLVDLTWLRIGQVTARRSRFRRPALAQLGGGVARLGDEVVLSADAEPSLDSLLALRAGAEAAERGLLLAPATADRLARAAQPLPDPWPDEARRLLVRLLAAGPGLAPVWQLLDQVGLVDAWLPEWAGVRLRTSQTVVHRHTIDRHCVETCVEAAARSRQVARPDLLVVAALLHDVGKGRPGDHSEVGAPVARAIAERWGFSAEDADRIEFMVRHHLLLPEVGTRRDLADPATVDLVVERCPDPEALDLLAALTESDAVATGPAAWTPWRADLVRRLVELSHARLGGASPEAPPAAPVSPEGMADEQRVRGWALRTESTVDGTRIWFRAVDRTGLLADVAAALSLAGLRVRAARADTNDDGDAVSCWDVSDPNVDADAVRLRLRRVLDGSLDPGARLAAASPSTEPGRVALLAGASDRATVLDVRATDRLGLVWSIASALSRAGADIRSAHLDTLGRQSADVFYLVGRDGSPLGGPEAERVRAAVERAVGG